MKGPRALPLLTLSPPSPEPAVPGVCLSARERRGAFFVASAAPSATARRNEIGQQKCSIRRRNAGNSSRNTPQREAGAGERGRAGGGAGLGAAGGRPRKLGAGGAARGVVGRPRRRPRGPAGRPQGRSCVGSRMCTLYTEHLLLFKPFHVSLREFQKQKRASPFPPAGLLLAVPETPRFEAAGS